jgi:Ni/Co efflux regulator RcnB
MRKALSIVLAAAVMAVPLAAPRADAAPKQKQPAPRERSDAAPSLDGRVLGYPRTCGYDHFQYSTSGTPVGPYCH